ncbi:hypothetical protein [Flavisolibacter ginsenosidimutans]|uniref:DUF885 domain-containing protein n=1 Tax=Flavisolibacter ginsenosidimutans TaxID=661481 RepID=A0A5B8UMT4_9BACT|nr:hypothetical protein [Flavisolibacter ginsenosidimutans]QEC57944.1 hypothetical protein FSB75_19210 [Flavisolibacter ginsenosidimutans]
MRFYKKLFVFVLMLALAGSSRAQSIADIPFKELLEKMPLLPKDLAAAQQAYGKLGFGEIPTDYKSAMSEIEAIKKQGLKPLFDYFQANAKKAAADQKFRLKFSAEEQRLLRDFATLNASWEESSFSIFSDWIDHRPGITKQSWTKINAPLSGAGQGLHEQLVRIENSVNWERFFDEAREREPMILSDPKINVLNEQYTKELTAVPKKKVKLFEGFDALADVSDPDKSIAVTKKWSGTIQAEYGDYYRDQYAWWSVNLARFKTAAAQLDGILQATNFGKNLAGNDKQLLPVIADVQERVMAMLYHLHYTAARISGIVTQVAANRLATEQAIDNFKKIPAQ